MRLVTIYQTLEDRGNYKEVEDHGPYFCAAHDENGQLKKGTKEPWLGEGYYFWDTRKTDAQWWGKVIYESHFKGYVICETQYDQHSPLLFDLLGNVSHMDEFEECALGIRNWTRKNRISVPYVLGVLRKSSGFLYKAVRAWPDPQLNVYNPQLELFFPGNKAVIRKLDKVQICFFDKTLLDSKFQITEKHPFTNYTI